MMRVSLANVAAKRTCLPLYEQHQATPHATFLDSSETNDIYSGMVMARTGADTVALCDGSDTTQIPFGLSALDRNDIIDDLNGLDIAPWAVWVGGADAEFFIDSPAFDTSDTYTVPSDGSQAYLYAGDGASVGKIVATAPAVGAHPVAELLEVVSSTRLRVRPLPHGAAL